MKRIIRKINWFFQKVFRGYSEHELWGLDFHLSKYLLKRIKAFRKLDKYGFPAKLESMEEWNAILDKIIFALEFSSFDYGLDEKYKEHEIIFPRLEKPRELFTLNDKPFLTYEDFQADKYQEFLDKYNEGMKLFAEYFSNLGD